MIVLKSKIQTVASVLYKTKARMFGNLRVGDKIEFSVPLKYAGGNRGQTHATYVNCMNLLTGEQTFLSFNQLDTMLHNFELKEE